MLNGFRGFDAMSLTLLYWSASDWRITWRHPPYKSTGGRQFAYRPARFGLDCKRFVLAGQ
jgi:hypothetical protein